MRKTKKRLLIWIVVYLILSATNLFGYITTNDLTMLILGMIILIFAIKDIGTYQLLTALEDEIKATEK